MRVLASCQAHHGRRSHSQGHVHLQYRARQYRVKANFEKNFDRRTRNLKNSEQAFERILQQDPLDMRAYVSLGTLYQRSGRIDQARHVFEEGCAVAEGRNAFIWTAMANLERKVPPVRLLWMRCGGPRCWRVHV